MHNGMGYVYIYIYICTLLLLLLLLALQPRRRIFFPEVVCAWLYTRKLVIYLFELHAVSRPAGNYLSLCGLLRGKEKTNSKLPFGLFARFRFTSFELGFKGAFLRHILTDNLYTV